MKRCNKEITNQFRQMRAWLKTDQQRQKKYIRDHFPQAVYAAREWWGTQIWEFLDVNYISDCLHDSMEELDWKDYPKQ